MNISFTTESTRIGFVIPVYDVEDGEYFKGTGKNFFPRDSIWKRVGPDLHKSRDGLFTLYQKRYFLDIMIGVANRKWAENYKIIIVDKP
jgi:hypothetical protein